MKEVRGNLWTWDPPGSEVVKIRVITTNGTIRKDGACVMGRGCAVEALRKFHGINYILGTLIQEQGNHVHLLPFSEGDWQVVSFPVKHHWADMADLMLIRRSAEELVKLADEHLKPGEVVILPRPGCGNGQLTWNVVSPAIANILDDRFYVITF